MQWPEPTVDIIHCPAASPALSPGTSSSRSGPAWVRPSLPTGTQAVKLVRAVGSAFCLCLPLVYLRVLSGTSPAAVPQVEHSCLGGREVCSAISLVAVSQGKELKVCCLEGEAGKAGGAVFEVSKVGVFAKCGSVGVCCSRMVPAPLLQGVPEVHPSAQCRVRAA